MYGQDFEGVWTLNGSFADAGSFTFLILSPSSLSHLKVSNCISETPCIRNLNKLPWDSLYPGSTVGRGRLTKRWRALASFWPCETVG